MYNILSDRNYTSEDCATMSRAYEMATAIIKLDRTRTDDRLGWTIMKLYDQGMRDAKLIAIAAVGQEKENSFVELKPR